MLGYLIWSKKFCESPLSRKEVEQPFYSPIFCPQFAIFVEFSKFKSKQSSNMADVWQILQSVDSNHLYFLKGAAD